VNQKKSAVRGLFKGCLGCFGFLALVVAAAVVRWKTLPPATGMLAPALTRFAAHWNVQDIKDDLDSQNLNPTVLQGWKDLTELLRANVGEVGPLEPLTNQNLMVNLNGSATATYHTRAVSKKNGETLDITASCVYGDGKWKILGIHFDSPGLLKPIKESVKP